MPSTRGLQSSLAKYDAFITDIRMSDYGYWVVTFSCAPDLQLSMMVCKTGLSRQQVAEFIAPALTQVTRQKVRR